MPQGRTAVAQDNNRGSRLGRPGQHRSLAEHSTAVPCIHPAPVQRRQHPPEADADLGTDLQPRFGGQTRQFFPQDPLYADLRRRKSRHASHRRAQESGQLQGGPAKQRRRPPVRVMIGQQLLGRVVGRLDHSIGDFQGAKIRSRTPPTARTAQPDSRPECAQADS